MLRHFTNIRELEKSIRAIKRHTKPLATFSNKAPSVLAAINTIDIRGGKKPDSSGPKLSPAEGRELNKKTDELNKLMLHEREINNILNTLQNEFDDADYPEKTKLLIAAKKLAATISEKVQKTKAALSVAARDTLPSQLGQVANILKRALDKQILPTAKSSTTTALTALIKDQPQHTMYFVYKEVTDDKGEVTPLMVIGLSNLGSQLYINPTLHDVVPPGKFKLGFPLTGQNPSQMAQAALKEINTQLLVDSKLSAVTGHPVPLKKSQLKYLKFDNNIKIKFNDDNDALIVTVDTSNTDEKTHIARKRLNATEAQEVANNLTRQISSLILRDKSLPTLAIRYTKRELKPAGYGWEFTFKFIPSGKYTGKTLDQQDVDHLRKRFTDEDIHQMLLSLNKQ